MNFFDIWPVMAFMAVQTVAIVWWAATMTARVGQLEKDAANHNGLGERMAKLEVSLEGIQATLQSIANDLKNRRRT